MIEKGCDNCYYTYFDERAYPCSLCIRGIERTDMWQPSKKTKAGRKNEPQMEAWHGDCNTCRWHDGACTIPCCDHEPKTEPQTEDKHAVCTGCDYYDLPNAFHPCASCVDFSKYKPKIKDEPQTEREGE